MSKRKNPPTSTAAFKSLDPEKIRKMYKDILSSLGALGSGTYEDIANDLHEKPERIWRRLSEMGDMGLIHRPGDRKLMSSGRYGMVWKVGAGPDIQKKKKVLKGPSVADFSRAILQPPPSPSLQQSLF